MWWFAAKTPPYERMLRRAGWRPHRAGRLVVVTDPRYYIGDLIVLPSEPHHYLAVAPYDGLWFRGPDHVPGKDYRGPTDAEEHRWLREGVHLRLLENPCQPCPTCGGSGKIVIPPCEDEHGGTHTANAATESGEAA
jgi:hypothetical protein